MARRRSVTLGSQDARALIAATAGAPAARESWVRLMHETAFDDVNENTQRLMPAIFHNLRDDQEVPERDRMRGAFKHAWSKNTGMLHDVRPVLAAFAAEGVDHRVIKGAAIQVLCASVGSRVMGDVDILVSAPDAGRATAILLDHGFRRSSHSTCDGHAESGHHASLDFNKGETHVDVHVAQYKHPSRLLTLMLQAPPVLVRSAGMAVAVPPAELLLLHAAVHGCLASGPTDFAQAAVDVCVLSQRTSPSLLVAAARRTSTLLALVQIEAAIRRAGTTPLRLSIPWSDELRARAEGGVESAVDVVAQSSSVVERMRVRQRGGHALHEVTTRFNGRRRSYGAWLRMGQFAVLERAVARTSGGFLEAPSGTWSSGVTARPFAGDSTPGLTGSRVSATALDWRFRVDFAAPQSTVRLALDSAGFDTLDAFVFCNGVPITRIVAGDPSTQDFVIRGLGRRNEFSVRALWAVCTECYRGLDDLSVRIDLGSPA